MSDQQDLFDRRTHYLVREHEGVLEYLNDFVRFDPSAKLLVEDLALHQGRLVQQLKDRGIQSTGTPFQNRLPLSKSSAIGWARMFALSSPESVVPNCRALTPFFQACEAAYEALCAHLKELFEIPGSEPGV